VRANRVGEVLRKMFNLAVDWGWRTDNPANGFFRRVENPRERFLSKEEIDRLAKALDAAEDTRAAGIIRICMLTGARVGEVRQARFEQFDLEHCLWSKPAATTKQRRVHRVPISEDVAAIVRQRRLHVPGGSPWLFPGDVPGQPVKKIRRFWVRIQKEAQIEDDIPHRAIAVIGALMDRRGQQKEGPEQIEGFIRIIGRDRGLDHGQKAIQVLDQGFLLAPVHEACRSPQRRKPFAHIRRHLFGALRC